LLSVLAGTAATVYVPMVEVVAKVVAYRYRGMAMGLVSSGTSYGVFVNSLLVPLYAPQGAWHVIWWWVGGIALGLSALLFWVFKRGGLLSKCAQPNTGPMTGEAMSPVPRQVALQQLLTTPWVLLVCSMSLLIGMATFPFQNYLSSYLRTELGFDVAYTAQIWASIGFVGMFAGLAVGWLSDKLGLRPVMLLVYVCLAASALILLRHPVGYWPMVAAVLFAAAFYPIFGLIPAYVSKLADTAATAVAIFAVVNVMQGAGGMLGNYAAGLLASHSGSFVGVYASTALLALVLMVLTIKLPSPGAENAQGSP
jgi:predicted MFS family arabinose efflux permease